MSRKSNNLHIVLAGRSRTVHIAKDRTKKDAPLLSYVGDTMCGKTGTFLILPYSEKITGGRYKLCAACKETSYERNNRRHTI